MSKKQSLFKGFEKYKHKLCDSKINQSMKKLTFRMSVCYDVDQWEKMVKWYWLTLICSSMAVAMFICMSTNLFFSNSSGSELTADVSLFVFSDHMASTTSSSSFCAP